MINDNMFPGIENILSWTARRQQALSSNIANLDTPGYRAKDYAFQKELSGIGLDSTNEKHISPEPESTVRSFEINSHVKANGNSVDLEQNMTELTKNALHYITLVQYLNSKLKTLKTSINDGGR
jgi:flagellar basal-body rod protein FlgB